jgi:hypothetical protein
MKGEFAPDHADQRRSKLPLLPSIINHHDSARLVCEIVGLVYLAPASSPMDSRNPYESQRL